MVIAIKRREVYIVGKKKTRKKDYFHFDSYLFLFGNRLKPSEMAGKD